MSEKESGNTGAAESCLFCAIQTDDRKRIVEENDYAYAIRDGFPVTPGAHAFYPETPRPGSISASLRKERARLIC